MRIAPGVTAATCLLLFLAPGAVAQRNLAGAVETQLALERLQVPARALMIAAHPDDENTALLAWLARGRKVRAGYLSITRGEGGQNLIGSEQGKLLGVIRTQELLAARRIDGAEQFFTSAVDFGFSKSVDETLATWGREKVLGEVVRTIREFRPDIIILRFSGTPRDGHGHHQASAILGKEAFSAAADPTRFPEQLSALKPWQAKRLLWNGFSFTPEQEKEMAAMPGRLEIDLGQYDPLLGFSYTEIAGMSRSEHRSQGMGSPERKGTSKNYFFHVAGDRASQDLFDNVPLRWPEPAASLLQQAAASFEPRSQHKTIPLLIKVRQLLPEHRRTEVDEAIALCAGIWVDASTREENAVTGSKVAVRLQAINRSPARVEWDGKALADNQPASRMDEFIAGSTSVESVSFQLRVEGQDIVLKRPVHYRYVDKVRGELTRPFVVVPPVSVRIGEPALLFPSAGHRTLNVFLRAFRGGESGTVRLSLPKDWTAKPESQPFKLTTPGEEIGVRFEVTPPNDAAIAPVKAIAETSGKELDTNVLVIDYPHIPPQTIFLQAGAKVIRADVKTAARTVGYIMGAGDEVPDALRQIGCDVNLLSPTDLAQADLSRFDAIVTGVRAYNTRPDIIANRHRLLDYMDHGGTLVVQYNVAERNAALSGLGPYPFKIDRGRVTVEDAPVEVLRSNHPLLSSPNKITSEDFAGWVQERGLYFATEWDPKYETLIASHDPGEKPLAGGLLYARYGKGAYVFTAYSWFRQLPAGVPGAYRIFANLLSAGKVQ